MTDYTKHPLTLTQQIDLLKQRGLVITDGKMSFAYQHLANISYFRLSAYTRPFYIPKQDEHRFITNTTLKDIIELYSFDRELRLLLLDAIERVEIALRAQITNTLADHYGAYAYLDASIFDNRYDHKWLLDKLEEEVKARDVEHFLHHYRQKYCSAPLHPPIWMALELLTFKAISTLFAKLRNTADTQRISQHFGVPHAVLVSWFRSISDLRNLCAHQMRVWNREFGSFPTIPKKAPAHWPNIPNEIYLNRPNHVTQRLAPQRRIYMQLVVLQTLMRKVSPSSQWSMRLQKLLTQNPQVSLWHMGFPDDWQNAPLWQGAQA